MIADLHIHTTASDGKLTPAQAVKWAKCGGIEVLSITDHDTVDGLDEGLRSARELGIKFVNGIEISAKSYCEVHILGYGINKDDAAFLNNLADIKRKRRERNAEIGRLLEKCGIQLDMDFTADGVGRMNIARGMVARGYVKDVNQAFDTYLGTGKKAYCASERVSPERAVEIIKDAGGFASLAHPKKFLLDGRLDKLLAQLKSAGLEGLEVNYPSHFDSDKDALRLVCKNTDFLPTGGSDFHGEEERNYKFNLDMRLIDALKIGK